MPIVKPWATSCVATALSVFSTLGGLCTTAQTPRDVVEKYRSLDAHGANQSSSNPNAKRIRQLVIDADEAGYDELVIIRSYRIGKPKVSGASADVEVIYADLGMIAGELEVNRDQHSEPVLFHLTRTEDGWKIDGLRLRAHISQEWMLSNLRGDLGRTQRLGKTDPSLSSAIRQISGW